MLIDNPSGGFSFLNGIEPYSCGVRADTGHEMVRVTFKGPIHWRTEFEGIDQYFANTRLDRCCLAAIELRSPHVRSLDEFKEFNAEYSSVIRDWNLFIDNRNPIARTNVVPTHPELHETVIHAFTHTRKRPDFSSCTFVVSGAGELRGGVLDVENLISYRDTSKQGLTEKVTFVRDVMTSRLIGLGATWEEVTAVSVYTTHPVQDILDEVVRPDIGSANRFGLQLFDARPPVLDIEFEMDTRGVYQEIVLAAE